MHGTMSLKLEFLYTYCHAGAAAVLNNDIMINPLKPNDPYRDRTAPLTSKVSFYIFIQQI